jgi:hypothetical protein
VTDPLNNLRDEAAYKAATVPELVEQYRAYWLELTAQPRPPHIGTYEGIEAARATMLAMLINETPIETAKEVLKR